MTKKTESKKESKSEFVKTLAIAVFCAVFIRSFFFEPFHIPSGSMKPTLLVGDYLFVSKYSYGYSRYSFPFGIKFFSGRIFKSTPQRGDVAVFRLPSDPKVIYIKRIIGLPGDKIQMVQGKLYINDNVVDKEYVKDFFDEQSQNEIKQFFETLPEGRKISVLDQFETPQDNTISYEVPAENYFMMGDNRDNSQDSRFQNAVGFVPEENLVGKAQTIFFSVDDSFWKFWKWHYSIRFSRIFKRIE